MEGHGLGIDFLATDYNHTNDTIDITDASNAIHNVIDSNSVSGHVELGDKPRVRAYLGRLRLLRAPIIGSGECAHRVDKKRYGNYGQQSGRPQGDAEVRGGRFRRRKGLGFQVRARPSTFRVRQARARPSNTSIRDLLSDGRYTEAVLAFLGAAQVGEGKEGAICK